MYLINYIQWYIYKYFYLFIFLQNILIYLLKLYNSLNYKLPEGFKSDLSLLITENNNFS